MTRPRVPRYLVMLVSAVAIAVVAAAAASRRMSPHATASPHAKATYYCPMHPSYTSDHPGDCPVCSMKLVKREPVSTPPTSREASSTHDVCYLHNCPKAHEGKPCPMLVVAKAGEKVTCPICGTHVAEAATTAPTKKILYWTDPMIPGYRANAPGKSPMGMELVPVYEDASTIGTSTAAAPDGYATVMVTPRKQQLIGVTTAPVIRRHLTKTLRAVGTIAHDPELYQAQAEYLQAVRSLEQATLQASPEVVDQAKRLVESSTIRLKHLGLNDELIHELAQRTEPEHGLLFTHPGAPVWVYAKVYEYELPLIHAGQAVEAEVPALQGARFHGTVRAIDPMVEPATRTTRIRAQLDDPEGRLKPEMYVNVSVAADLGEILAIPQEAVVNTGLKRLVFVAKGQGLFEPREVTLGESADGYAELTDGVAEGETVVTSGNFLIDSESRLNAALHDR